MEECCAVCAEPLEWVGYGPCGHREVCFTCIARLRFVLNDKRCCICKQDCPSVYVTKALGDYTRVVTDWKTLPSRLGSSNAGEGNLWYDSVVEAYFDDEEPYKTIKAMCRLYCSVCENSSPEDATGKGMMRKGYIFKNIETLRRHQFVVHRLFMCELCLEGRKVFMIEQKLYSKMQLDRHNYKGDSEVDGTEEERGGFAGHPECAFCKKRFYGDNELYQHMSQEHYTCHICQRARPGHYEYYRNYDDLEAHFRQEHVLCEHPDCLAKKFVVFPSEAELKRHNATTHGGHMSRSQRNAALQIPVSFHYRRTGQDSDDNNGGYSNRRGGRGRGGHPYSGGGRSDHLESAARASVESAQLEEAVRESSGISSSSDTGVNNPQGGAERGTSGESEAGFSGQGDGENEPSRYLAAVWGGGPSALGDAAFPPLPGTSKSARRRAKLKNQGPASMAALLGGNGVGGGRGLIRVLNTADYRPTLSNSSSSSGSQVRSVVEDRTFQMQSSTNRHEGVGTLVDTRIESSQAPSVNAVGGPGPPPVAGRSATGGESSSIGNGFHPRGEWAVPRGPTAGASSANGSALPPSRESVPVDRSNMVNPLAAQVSELSLDLRAANKALVERIRTGLKGNEQQYADFKDVSAQFRKGEMSSKEYYVHIARLGLSFIVPELARLCPDPQKGKELMEAHTATVTNNFVDPRSLPPGLSGAFPSLPSAKETEKAAPKPAAMKSVVSDAAGSSNSSNGNSSRYIPEEAVEQLSIDGYRRAKGKGRLEGGSSTAPPLPALGTEGTLLNELAAARDRKPQVLVKAFPTLIPEPPQLQTFSATSENPSASRPEIGSWACGLCTLVNSANLLRCAACDTPQLVQIGKDAADAASSGDKKKKKTSKFQRVRLGDGSAAALLDANTSNPWGQASQPEVDSRNPGSRSGRGVWNNGGGQRLVSLVQREAILDDAWNQGK